MEGQRKERDGEMRIFNKIEIRLINTNSNRLVDNLHKTQQYILDGEIAKAAKLYRKYKTDIGCSLQEAVLYCREFEKKFGYLKNNPTN
jgi:hypothetical protein